MSKEKILIFGTGGHAKSVYDVVHSEGRFEVFAFVDVAPKVDKFLNIQVLPQSQIAENSVKKGIIAIGDNGIREKVALEIKTMIPDFAFVVCVHKTAWVGSNVFIGNGSVVMANAVINMESHIGENCIINTGCVIEHDCRIGNFSSVGPGAIMGGGALLGNRSVLGIGTIVNHLQKVGDDTVVGSGAVVVSAIENNMVAVGAPAKEIRQRKRFDPYL